MGPLIVSLLLAVLLVISPAQALDTSAGVGLQDRALFQEKVDYTLTNQTGGDFHAVSYTHLTLPTICSV